jgi:hypothetical protein
VPCDGRCVTIDCYYSGRDHFGSYKIDTCLYACSTQSVSNWKLLPGTAHFKVLNLQHCNFMIINFAYFRILIV